mgnify:CR=1 FL=1
MPTLSEFASDSRGAPDSVVDAIDGLDADVTSIEAARSKMEVVGALAGDDQLQSLQVGGVQLHLGGGPVMHVATGALKASHGAQKLSLGGGVVVPVGVARRRLLWGPGHGRRVSE